MENGQKRAITLQKCDPNVVLDVETLVTALRTFGGQSPRVNFLIVLTRSS